VGVSVGVWMGVGVKAKVGGAGRCGRSCSYR
jgi:hypothetical protein